MKRKRRAFARSRLPVSRKRSSRRHRRTPGRQRVVSNGVVGDVGFVFLGEAAVRVERLEVVLAADRGAVPVERVDEVLRDVVPGLVREPLLGEERQRRVRAAGAEVRGRGRS